MLAGMIAAVGTVSKAEPGLSVALSALFRFSLPMFSFKLQQERRDAELRAKREEEEQRKRREEKRRQQEEQKRRDEEELFRRKQVG